MDQLNTYTSTGVKFWKHPKQMQSFIDGTGNTIISTHISPEGRCNLSCSFCSVKKRDKHFRIEPNVIKQYVNDLIGRGLKAVILTGGGESTLYPYFDEIVYYIASTRRLKIALITNGTMLNHLTTLPYFSWIRVSINNFKGWEKRINIPFDKVNRNCTMGASLVYSGENKKITKKQLIEFANKIEAEYVRIIPNCLHDQARLLKEHEEVKKLLEEINDKRFFHQFKIHKTPNTDICHQSFFRPYLSEVDGGTVYSCDSIVLNNQVEYFHNKYQLCKADKVLDYLDGKIKPNFTPSKDCKGCVFASNVRMLEEFKWSKEIPHEYQNLKELKHEEFI